MFRTVTMQVGEREVIGIEVELPKTKLVAIMSEQGYVMCGALDVKLLDDRLGDRQIVAGRAFGIRKCEDLLTAPLESVTSAARERGILPGMNGTEALLKMF